MILFQPYIIYEYFMISVHHDYDSKSRVNLAAF